MTTGSVLLLSFIILIIAAVIVLDRSFPVRYLHNFEAQAYPDQTPYLEPLSIKNGLAIYKQGSGPIILLFPYPHSHTTTPMLQSPLGKTLIDCGYTLISFDVPGAYRSTRRAIGDMPEMLACATETLERMGIDQPVDVMGHSMGGLCALAFAIEHPERVQRLALINSLSGFPAAARWGLPGSAFSPFQCEYWQVILWGMIQNSGRGSLALHKKLANLMHTYALHKKELDRPMSISPVDHTSGVPIRTVWSGNMYRGLSYAKRLHEVTVPTLITAADFDVETPLPCAQELLHGIKNARLHVFQHSGHYPFLEEPDLFRNVIQSFLKE